MTYIVGINCGLAASHDPSACLIDSRGTVLSFIEEERLTRVRHAPGALPIQAIARCLQLAGLSSRDVDVVAVGWDEPRLRARCGTPWEFTSTREFLSQLGFRADRQPDIYFVPHHRAHAAAAFHASPFHSAAVLIVDGNGEDESISIFRAQCGEPLVRLRSWPRVCSLGYLFEAAGDWLGLGRLGGGKTMALAGYQPGAPIDDAGWFDLTSGHLVSVLGDDPLLDYDELISQWRRQIQQFSGLERSQAPPSTLNNDAVAVRVASAAQRTVELTVGWLAAEARDAAGQSNLCLAGGVALNCASNGRLSGSVYVPPVPHDAGVALGAAWSIAPPAAPQALSPYLGGLPEGPLPSHLSSNLTREPLNVDRVVNLLLDGAVVALCRGRSEVGPRALCHRSLLASPVTLDMRDRLNRIKRRELWRPFGPVTNSQHDLWLSGGELERYMVGAAALTQKGMASVPAVRHVDNTTRPQRLQATDEAFVDAVLNGLVHAGHPPVLVNTSFNGPNEPIVETASDAAACAARLGVEFLVLNDTLLHFSSLSERPEGGVS